MPLFKDVRELILQKCVPGKERQVRAIFETHPFGDMERLVTQKLLDVVKKGAKDELDNEAWLRSVAHLAGRSYEGLRVSILEFLDTDVFSVSKEHCSSFLEPLIESWDIDLATFGLEIVLNRRLISGHAKKVEFVEKEVERTDEEPGLKKFLKFEGVRADITDDEIEFLRKLRFKDRQPTALYYYRELQNLRDPLHFRAAWESEEREKDVGPIAAAGSVAPMQRFSDARGIEKQLQLERRKGAIRRWDGDQGAGIRAGGSSGPIGANVIRGRVVIGGVLRSFASLREIPTRVLRVLKRSSMKAKVVNVQYVGFEVSARARHVQICGEARERHARV